MTHDELRQVLVDTYARTLAYGLPFTAPVLEFGARLYCPPCFAEYDAHESPAHDPDVVPFIMRHSHNLVWTGISREDRSAHVAP